MARPREFNPDKALAAAVEVFREHGFAGTSTQMLTEAMQIGKQSLYNTFGDKWQVYCAAVRQYVTDEIAEHLEMLQGGSTAIEGIERMLERVVTQARRPCLGVNSVVEFGDSCQDLMTLRKPAAQMLHTALLSKTCQAQRDRDFSASLDPNHGVTFLMAHVAAIRIAARGGASEADLRALSRLALNALR